MTKQEFLQLFKLEDIYEKYQKQIPFSFALNDRIVGTDTSIFWGFHSQNTIKLCIDSIEFSVVSQQLEIHFLIENNQVKINYKEPFINNIFTFLTFETDFVAALKFLSDFILQILIPKYQLMGNVSIH